MSRTRDALIVEIGDAMQAYHRSTRAFDDAVTRALGINPADLRCLDALGHGAKSAGEISVATGLSSAATTDLIDRLAREGFVRRLQDAADRRRVLVELTPPGRERVGRYYGPLAKEGTALFAGVPSEELTQMRDWLIAARRLTDRQRERIGGR